MRNLVPNALLAATLAFGLSTPAALAQDMTEAERSAFNEAVRAYLLENPEVILEAMQVLEDRQALAAEANDQALVLTYSEAIFNDGTSWVGGNPDGDITLVEFIDYRCGYCRKAYTEIEELVKRDGNIRFVLKEFPILGEESLLSSQFAVAVQLMADDATYKAAHDQLIALRGVPDEATLSRLAADLGLNPAEVLARMTSAEVAAVIDANHGLASQLDISGTPTFILGDTMIRGYLPLDAMQEIVAEERAG